jgi:hypothetical protein
MRNWIAGGVLLLSLAGCSGILPRESNASSSKFETYEQFMASYAGIRLGQTRLNDLNALGFGTQTTPNIVVLSYMEIVDRFLPAEGMTLQQAPPAVRLCIAAQFRCSAYVFHFQNSKTQRSGGVVPDMLGIARHTVNDGWSAEAVLLLQDDLVVYKIISSRPYIQERHDKTRPLGPLQDMGSNISGSPSK